LIELAIVEGLSSGGDYVLVPAIERQSNGDRS